MKIVQLWTVVTLLTACGPMYETRYEFEPPRDRQGAVCISNCEALKMQCEELERMRTEHCEDRARWEQQRCEDSYYRRGKKPKWYDCSGSSCSSDYTRCEANHRLCYENCGGTVTAQDVCVYNCGATQD